MTIELDEDGYIMPTRRSRRPLPEAPREMAVVSVAVDPILYDRAFKVLAKRGVDMETYLRLMLMKCRDNPILELSDIIEFGKFRGECLDTIIRVDPHYVEWLLRVKDAFTISEEAVDLLNEIQSL